MKEIKTATFTLSLLLLLVSSVFAIEYNGIGGVPANPREDNPRTENIFVYENAPGSVVQDGVVVINNTSETKTILVYATDTTPSSDGGFACKQFVEEVTEEGTWFDLEKSEVTLEANKNIIVPFTVSIPDDASVGEHNACIVIQEKKEADTDAGVNLNFRAAIRAIVTVPGDIQRKLDIKSFEYFKTENNKNTLALILSNTGNVSLDTDIKIEVKNILTSKLFFSNDASFSILHSNEQTFNFDLDNNPWGGIYKGIVTVTYQGASGPETLTKELVFVIIPSVYAMALYAVSLIVVITALLLIGGSKRKVKMAIKGSQEYIVKDGDTLNSIAKDHSVNWKLLAKINNKKPPYDVVQGERLSIPSIKTKKQQPKQTLPIAQEPVINDTSTNLYTQESATTPANPQPPVPEIQTTPPMTETPTTTPQQPSAEDIIKDIQSQTPPVT